MQESTGISHITANQALEHNALDTFILEMNSEIDNISVLLREIEMIFYDTNEYFKGDVADALRNKFDRYKRQLEVVKANLLSYPEDLSAIKNSMINNDENLSLAYSKFAENIMKKANIQNKEE